MTCYMIYLGHTVILTKGQILKLTFAGQVMYGSIRFDETNSMVGILIYHYCKLKIKMSYLRNKK